MVKTSLALIAVLAAVCACRNDETQNSTNHAVSTVDDTADKRRVGEFADTDSEFKVQKSVRIATLRGVHAIAASQPMLISLVNDTVPLHPRDKFLLDERTAMLSSRLGEAANAISVLSAADAKTWSVHERAAAEALNRVEAARSDAFDALDKAERITDRTTMR